MQALSPLCLADFGGDGTCDISWGLWMPSFYSLKFTMEIAECGWCFLVLLHCDFSGGLNGDQDAAVPKATD